MQVLEVQMDFVCDTNVWYDIGAGMLDPAKLKLGGNRLLSPALNTLEISSNLDDRTLTSRKRASQAILDHADEHLEDPERYIGAIWGLNLPPLNFDWKDVCRTIVASNDIAEMISGAQKIMKVNTAAAQAWRKGFTEKFVVDVETVIRKYVPKYASRRANGRMDYLTGTAHIAKLHTDLNCAIVKESQILLTRTRASDHLTVEPNPPIQADIDVATPLLMPFVNAYLTFLEKVATVQAARPNDWGDLHCFVYLQGNRKLLTGENKWLKIANDSGMAHLVQDSKAI